MAEQAEAPPVEPQGDPAPEPNQEPKKYAGKFESPEKLEEAYKALEKKLGQPKPKPSESQDPSDILSPPKPQPVSDDMSYNDIVKGVGYDPGNMYAKWAETGEVPDDFFNKVKSKFGFPKSLVKDMVNSQFATHRSRVESATQKAIEVAGSAEAWDSLKAWSANLPPQQLQSLRAVINNPDTTDIGVEKLKRLYNEHIGAGGSRPLASGSTPTDSGRGFTKFEDYANALTLKAAGKADSATLEKLKHTPQSVIDRANRPG